MRVGYQPVPIIVPGFMPEVADQGVVRLVNDAIGAKPRHWFGPRVMGSLRAAV